MRKIKRADYFELATFLMDYHSGQASRGYRLLCRLRPERFTPAMMEECRETEIYVYLVEHYAHTV